ncbi:MAG: type II toxin-antitoxin system VapC family toxin [Planctomycetota bacterium]|jgi:predicted nucleic acid-binding protein|nr:type II toxin-antitoxin system VapC family toxin [Planctomycetota bacterium]
MNIVDSSCWIEYYATGDLEKEIVETIEAVAELLVPSIVVYEVFKKILADKTHYDALAAVAHLRRGKIIDLNEELALIAVNASRKHRLPLADSIIYATAQKHHCALWTKDRHFAGLECVRYFAKS